MKQKFEFMDFMIYLLCGLFTLLCFYPIYNTFINTISDNRLVTAGRVMWYPLGLHFKNFQQFFRLTGLIRATMVSVARTALGTLLSVFTVSFMAYAITRPEYWLRKVWYRFIIATMYLSAGLIPGYLLMYNLRLTNNFLVYIIGGLAPAPFYLVLVKTFIESIPFSMDESAEIDGAGYIRRYFQVNMPLCKPILATIIVFTAVGQWNAVMDTVIYMSNDKWYTLQIVLYKFMIEADRLANTMRQLGTTGGAMSEEMLRTKISPAGVRYTATVVIITPILLVYPFMQRYFVKGIMIGAIKG